MAMTGAPKTKGRGRAIQGSTPLSVTYVRSKDCILLISGRDEGSEATDQKMTARIQPLRIDVHKG
jgi:hypothetical protein